MSKHGWYTIGRIRFHIERNWRQRPYPYWFHAKYDDLKLKHRFCIPFLTLDILRKKS